MHPRAAVTSVGRVTVRGVTLCITLGLASVACSDDDPSTVPTTTTTVVVDTTTTTVPERPTSTTTTAFDPASVEGEVEAAYLRSWDVYADAVYDLELDEAALAEVYAEEALELRIDEVNRRIQERRASLVRVDHDYQVVVVDESTVNVIDTFVNHQVLIDPDSRVPIEDDPNETLLVNFKLRLIDGSWRVVFIQKVTS